MNARLAGPVIALFWIALFGLVAFAAQMPLATSWDQAHAQLAITPDGQTITIRAVAPASLRVCFERPVPARDACVLVGDVRSGRVTLR